MHQLWRIFWFTLCGFVGHVTTFFLFGQVRKPIVVLHHCAVLAFYNFKTYKLTGLRYMTTCAIWMALKLQKIPRHGPLLGTEYGCVSKKIIDNLHIRNHKDPSCQELYSPANLKKELPEGYTMAVEKTFGWLSRFKKIVCAMPKVHHLFYLHRMVKRGSKDTTTCYKNSKKPLLPKARGAAGSSGQN